MFSTVVEQAVHPITGTYKAEYIYRWMVSTFHYCIRYNKLMVDMPTAGIVGNCVNLLMNKFFPQFSENI